mgnify:CR=1 FL=1
MAREALVKFRRPPRATDLDALADAIDGSATGLYALPLAPAAAPEFAVRHAGIALDRDVAFERLTIRLQGDHFEVERVAGKIEAAG